MAPLRRKAEMQRRPRINEDTRPPRPNTRRGPITERGQNGIPTVRELISSDFVGWTPDARVSYFGRGPYPAG